MARIVKQAKLHQSAFFPGVGDLGTTLPPLNKTLNLEMTYSPEGIHLQVGPNAAIIPWANVVIATLGPELKPAALASVKGAVA